MDEYIKILPGKIPKKHLRSITFNFRHRVSLEWITTHIVNENIMKPSTKLRELKQSIRKKINFFVTTSKWHRTRWKAMLAIEGNISDHYENIWDYVADICVGYVLMIMTS